MDFWGYKLASTYNELTSAQALFLDIGRAELEYERNGGDKAKHSNKNHNRIKRTTTTRTKHKQTRTSI